MYEYVNKMKKVQGAIRRFKLFYILLDFLLVLLVFSLIFLLINIPVYYAVVFSTGSAIWKASKRRINIFNAIEEKYDYFKERLKAAYDNREKSNVILKYLSEEISQKFDQVRYSSFLDSKKITSKVTASMLLVIIFLFLTFFNIRAFDAPGIFSSILKKPLEEFPETPTDEVGYGVGKDTLKKEKGVAGSDVFEDIYGQTSIAKIEGEKISLELHVAAGEMKLRDIKEKEDAFSVTQPTFPITPAIAESYTENIPEKYEEVVKKYFEKLAEESK